MELVAEIYKVSNRFPESQKYSLVSQMQRAAVSIPSNIAEGAGRDSDNEFSRFLKISNGSCCELETQVRISESLGFLRSEESSKLINQITEI